MNKLKIIKIATVFSLFIVFNFLISEGMGVLHKILPLHEFAIMSALGWIICSLASVQIFIAVYKKAGVMDVNLDMATRYLIYGVSFFMGPALLGCAIMSYYLEE